MERNVLGEFSLLYSSTIPKHISHLKIRKNRINNSKINHIQIKLLTLHYLNINNNHTNSHISRLTNSHTNSNTNSHTSSLISNNHINSKINNINNLSSISLSRFGKMVMKLEDSDGKNNLNIWLLIINNIASMVRPMLGRTKL